MVKPFLSIALIVIIITVFLLFNAPLAFGAQADLAKDILLFYMIALAIFTAVFDVKIAAVSLHPSFLIFFIAGFIVTAIILSTIRTAQPFAASTQLIQALSFGFLYAFVIAFYEEIIFRDLLPLRLGLGDAVAQPLFGIFHASAISSRLGFDIVQIIVVAGFLTLLGFIWASVRNKVTILGSTGSHFAYNLFAQGIL